MIARVLLGVLCLLAVAVSAKKYELHRAVQATGSGGIAGARGSVLRGPAVFFNPFAGEKPAANAVLVIDVDAVASNCEELDASSLFETKCGGFLFVLPTSGAECPTKFVHAIEEKLAITREIAEALEVPVFFTKDHSLVDDVKETGDLLFSTPLFAPVDAAAATAAHVALTDITAPVFTVTFRPHGAAQQEDEWKGKAKKRRRSGDGEDSKGSLLVASHFDTLGVVPNLVAGGGTGATALLELARMYSRASFEDPSMTSLQFLLSSGSKASYFGTKQFIGETSSRDLDKLNFVLCLEDLVPSSDNKMFLHISKHPKKDDPTYSLLERMSGKAKEHGIELELVVKRIDVAHAEMRWEHEPFAYRKIPAATLSARRFAVAQLSRDSVVPPVVDVAKLRSVVQFLGEFIEGEMGLKKPAAGLSVDAEHLEIWNEFHKRFPRSVQYASPSITAAYSNFFTSLSETPVVHNNQLTSVVTKRSYIMTPEKSSLTYHGPAVFLAQIVEAKSFEFELLITGLIGLFCFVVASIHFGIDGAKTLFTSTTAAPLT